MKKRVLILAFLCCQPTWASVYTITNRAKVDVRVFFKVVTGADMRTRWILPGQTLKMDIGEDVRFIKVRPMMGRGDTLGGQIFEREKNYTLYLVQDEKGVHFLKRSILKFIR